MTDPVGPTPHTYAWNGTHSDVFSMMALTPKIGIK